MCAQVVPRLAGSLPVWLEEDGWEESAEELDDIFLGDAELWQVPSKRFCSWHCRVCGFQTDRVVLA